jgi:hypothetical protein
MTNWSSAQSAVAALPNLQLPNPLLICGFLGLYLVAVGPLNYLVLRQLKRRELAWVTIPVIVLGFSLVAYIAGYGLAGNQPTLHQLSIVQAWPDAAQARVDQVVGIFSPRRTSYDMEFAPGQLVRPLPGYGLPGTAALRVEQGERTRLFGVRTEIASVQTFVAQGFVPAPRMGSSLRMELIAGSARLLGAVTNDSNLALRDAVLLAPGGVLRLGDFRPGATTNVSLILSSGRASSLPPNSVVPFTTGAGAVGAIPPYYSSSYDTTIDDILGNSNYYTDRDQYRRYSLLSAAINTYSGATGLGRGAGVYLIGWTAQSPAPATVLNVAYKTLDETVYIFALPSGLDIGNGPVTIPPGMMTWAPLSAAHNSGAASPYDATLYGGDQFAVRYTPVQPLAYGQVQDLTLRLSGNSYGPSGQTITPGVELWDFAGNTWAPVDVAGYGLQSVPEPHRFVGPGGEIRTRLSNPTNDTITLSYVEFELTVEQ